MNPQQTPIPVLDDSDSAVHAEFKKPIEFFGNLIPHWIISNSGGSKVHFEFPTFKGFKDPQTRVTVESEQAMVDAWVMGINGSPPIRAWEIVPSEHGLVVLDLDTHGGDGFATLRELSNRSGIEVAESFYTLSPEHPCFEITSRDGIHLYFKWDGPTLPKGLLGKGIEILQDSVFVAGSKKYPDKPQTRLVGSYGEIPKVPQFLQDLFEFCLNEKESVEPEARSENWIQDFQKNNLGTNDVFEQARRIFPSRIESLFKTDGAYWKNANYHTLSPLRNDQHIGSFSVNEDGRWYDFATQESGDGISLVARWKNLSLLESAKFIIGEKTESHFLSDSEELAQEPQQRRTDLFPLVHISQMRVTKPNWLIDKFIESATLVGLFGESGSYKTFLALSMAMAVASGKDWYGHNTQQGAVLYLIGEGKDGFIRRINAWGKENAVDPKKIPFYSYSTDSVMDNQYSVQKLIDSIRESVSVSLRAIFVDTLARALGDAEENSSRDINRFANLCKRLKKALDALWSSSTTPDTVKPREPEVPLPSKHRWIMSIELIKMPRTALPWYAPR